jgi:hypothetical protein
MYCEAAGVAAGCDALVAACLLAAIVRARPARGNL